MNYFTIKELHEINISLTKPRYEGHADSVYSVAFSPDGKSLASGSLDKTLKLWDLSGSRARSRCRSTFNGHKDFVLSVAFSPDGNWLISGSKDRSVQFWDPRNAVTHMMLQGHKNSGTSPFYFLFLFPFPPSSFPLSFPSLSPQKHTRAPSDTILQ